MPPASYLTQARIADQYRQALRDGAMHPAIHYDLARARIADLHRLAHRTALARAARQARRERAGQSR